MFCIKCGNELPDVAIFCSKCGTKTANENKCGTNDKTEEIVQPSLTEEEIKRRELLAKEKEKQIADGDRRIREALQREIQQLKDEKSAWVRPVVVIAVIISLVAVVAFAVFFSADRLSEGINAFFVAILALAIAVGMLIGAGISNSRFNERIEKKEAELRTFNREVSGRITLSNK